MVELTDITQDAFTAAEDTIIELLRSKYPALDLRKGTVLRETLVKPYAQLFAADTERLAELTATYSIDQLSDTSDPEAVDRLLSNFLVTRRAGTKSYGPVSIRLQYNQDYTFPTTLIFRTVDGLEFSPVNSVTVYSTTNVTADKKLVAVNGEAYYLAVIDVQAAETGVKYKLVQGTMLDCPTGLVGFIMAEAYTDFSGGLETETSAQLLARLPVDISNRSFDSPYSIEARFRDREPSIEAVSVAGMANPEQLRDKHYIVAVGSRVDVFVKSFHTLPVMMLRKTAVCTATGVHQFDIGINDVPGYVTIRSISVVTEDNSITIGSLAFDEVRTADLTGVSHDFDISQSYIETDYSRWQKSTVTVYGAAVQKVGSTVELQVEVSYAPMIDSLQSYVDDASVGSCQFDVVVRAPLVCHTSIRLVAYQSALLDPLSTSDMATTVMEHVNSIGFGTTLDKSQVVSALTSHYELKRIDVSDNAANGMVLTGWIRAAGGTVVNLSGAELNIYRVTNTDIMLSPRTCVFNAAKQDIDITVVRE